MAELVVKITNELKAPAELGIHHRFICMTGPNKGKVYYLLGKRIIIGRSDKSDIQILDDNISREHAELSLVNGEYVITDLSQHNGIIVNDKKLKQCVLDDGVKIVIGQSVLKYNLLDIDLNALKRLVGPKELLSMTTAAPSDNNLVENKKKVQNSNAPRFIGAPASVDSYGVTNEKKSNSKLTIVGIIVLGGVYLMLAGDEGGSSSKVAMKKKSNEALFDEQSDKELSLNKRLAKEDPEIKRKFEMLIHSGRREYREGNYFRAMEEFRRADLLIPGNGLASFLMSRSKQSLDEDVSKNFSKASRDVDAKKFKTALVSLCGILQLLQNYPEDERYKNAKEKIQSIEIEMGLEKNEIKCGQEKPTDSKH